MAMLKNMSMQDVPLPGHLEHDVIRYEGVDELKQRIKDHFRPYVKPGATDGGQSGREAPL
jgi:hypothetical protein